MGPGEFEIDDSYFGGREANRRKADKQKKGSGPAGKQPVMGMRDRKEGHVRAVVVKDMYKATTSAAINENVKQGSMLYTDSWKGYKKIPATPMNSSITRLESTSEGRSTPTGSSRFGRS